MFDFNFTLATAHVALGSTPEQKEEMIVHLVAQHIRKNGISGKSTLQVEFNIRCEISHRLAQRK